MPNIQVVREFLSPEQNRKYVTVLGRKDIGEVMDAGINFGFPKSIYALGVHFPLDGLCAYYHADRVTYVEKPEITS
jgi:hypothetical protein